MVSGTLHGHFAVFGWVSLVQLGLRHRLPGGRAVVGLAAGVGTNRDSPSFEIAFAVQWSFSAGGL